MTNFIMKGLLNAKPAKKTKTGGAYNKRSVQKELDKQKIKPKAQKLYHAFLKGHEPKEGDSYDA